MSGVGSVSYECWLVDLSIVATIKSVSVVRGGKVVNTVNCPYGPKSVAINPDNTEVERN